MKSVPYIEGGRTAISRVADDVQPHWGPAVPPLSGRQSLRNSWGFPGLVHDFLEEEDATSLRRRHRRCTQDLAARMSRTSLRDTEDRTADVSPHRPVRGAGSSKTTGSVRPHRSGRTLYKL